jgi:glucose/arabinose dehydrogenase
MTRIGTAAATALAICSAIPASGQIRLRAFASGFARPVAFVQDPSDRSVQYVVEQGGRIRPVVNGVVQLPDFLDLTSQVASDGERGLLGLAFAPDYATSGRCYVNFTNAVGNSVIARFRRSAAPRVADAASRFDLRWNGASGPASIAQPFANHNGGHLAFGPDGYLYVGLGDGGSANDPGNRAQTPSDLLGKMLRVDVNVPDADPIGYRIPAGNPFVGGGPPGTRPEIWAFGLRNPWRYSFDHPADGGTGALIIADVGQGGWEEIDYEPLARGGRNYGWSVREGAHDNVTSSVPAFTPLIDPTYEYSHAVGQSITGGFVYRARLLGPAFRGRYFFADFSTGRVWSIAFTTNPTGEAMAGGLIEQTADLGGPSAIGNISSFGVDADGELHLVSYSQGTIVKLVNPAFQSRVQTDFDGDGRADFTVYRPGTGTWFVDGHGSRAWGIAPDLPVPGDYDGDGRTDVALYRRASGTWFIEGLFNVLWGAAGDIPVPADYDGDGRTDIAVFRPSNGTWYIYGQGAIVFGQAGDIPIPGDYANSGRATPAIYRQGLWFVPGLPAAAWGLGSDFPVPADYNGDDQIDIAVYRPASGTWYIRGQFAAVWGTAGDQPLPQDVDGDGRADLVVYRPDTAQWFAYNVRTGSATFAVFGSPGDIPVLGSRFRSAAAGDFDGDRRADLVMFNSVDATWRSRLSTLQFAAGPTVSFGARDDVPVPADYAGYRRSQRAVFRAGVWFIEGGPTIRWGSAGDVAVPADYDGDGRADPAVFRDGSWSILSTATSYATTSTVTWGAAGDRPVPGDYDGDGRADPAVYRGNGAWYVLLSGTSYATAAADYTGGGADVPVPGDYEGDGLIDVAVFRPAVGTWFVRRSSFGPFSATRFFVTTFGVSGDVPVPADYDGDGREDVAVYRSSNATWYVLGQVTLGFGGAGELPLLGPR